MVENLADLDAFSINSDNKLILQAARDLVASSTPVPKESHQVSNLRSSALPRSSLTSTGEEAAETTASHTETTEIQMQTEPLAAETEPHTAEISSITDPATMEQEHLRFAVSGIRADQDVLTSPNIVRNSSSSDHPPQELPSTAEGRVFYLFVRMMTRLTFFS